MVKNDSEQLAASVFIEVEMAAANSSSEEIDIWFLQYVGNDTENSTRRCHNGQDHKLNKLSLS